MKIWIDFINTPQVSFFVPFIREFEQEGHELLLTCRDSGNTVALLKQQKLDYHIIGEEAAKGKAQKMSSFAKRLVQLYTFIRKHQPDVAASQSSFYQPVVAKLLNIPSLYTNDNEHAQGNLFGFWFASKVILPDALRHEPFTQKSYLKSKLSFYPSVKEAIYLSQQPDLQAGFSEKKNMIYFRPEPRTAQYYQGPLNFFDDTLLKLSKDYEVIVLPRDKQQRMHYTQDLFAAITVPNEPLSLRQIASNCLLFIGAGGSMTRELAVLGIPVVSVYQAESLCVDNYLVEKGLLQVNPQITYEEIKLLLQTKNANARDRSVLSDGEKSYALIRDSIIALCVNHPSTASSVTL